MQVEKVRGHRGSHSVYSHTIRNNHSNSVAEVKWISHLRSAWSEWLLPALSRQCNEPGLKTHCWDTLRQGEFLSQLLLKKSAEIACECYRIRPRLPAFILPTEKQKYKKQTKQQPNWNTSRHFLSYYGFFSKLDPASGIKPVPEQAIALQTIPLGVRKAIVHSSGLLGALCWTVPQPLTCCVMEHTIFSYKSYAVSCFFKIPQKATPKKRQAPSLEGNTVELTPGESTASSKPPSWSLILD